MKERKRIGRVSATEKNPSSCDEFQFWLSDDTVLSPFDIVCVENKDGSITYGVVQDIFHITDGSGHISNYVSSDFGDVDRVPMTKRLSLSYAQVSVVHNTKENFMPVWEGSAVYAAADKEDVKAALGLSIIDESKAIPAGIMKIGNNVSVPISYNGDFLIGPEGAHMNVSGISGLATKTSYVMFLLKAIQHQCKNDVAIIVMNVKGDDLLHIHQPNNKITNEQRKDWKDINIPCTPFDNVKYYYPYRNQKDKLYANTALSLEDLEEQFRKKTSEELCLYIRT